MSASFIQAETELLNCVIGHVFASNRVIGLTNRSFSMVRANVFRELIAFKGTQVTPVSFHGCNCTLLLDGPGICQDSSNWALLPCFFFPPTVIRKINYLNLSSLCLSIMELQILYLFHFLVYSL